MGAKQHPIARNLKSLIREVPRNRRDADHLRRKPEIVAVRVDLLGDEGVYPKAAYVLKITEKNVCSCTPLR